MTHTATLLPEDMLVVFLHKFLTVFFAHDRGYKYRTPLSFSHHHNRFDFDLHKTHVFRLKHSTIIHIVRHISKNNSVFFYKTINLRHI